MALNIVFENWTTRMKQDTIRNFNVKTSAESLDTLARGDCPSSSSATSWSFCLLWPPSNPIFAIPSSTRSRRSNPQFPIHVYTQIGINHGFNILPLLNHKTQQWHPDAAHPPGSLHDIRPRDRVHGYARPRSWVSRFRFRGVVRE